MGTCCWFTAYTEWTGRVTVPSTHYRSLWGHVAGSQRTADDWSAKWLEVIAIKSSQNKHDVLVLVQRYSPAGAISPLWFFGSVIFTLAHLGR